MSLGDLVVGIDIGGTNTPFALVDGAGRQHGRGMVPTRGREPVDQLLQRLVEGIETLLVGIEPGRRVVAVGAGAPNANARTGWVESPPNVSWGRCHLAGELSKRLDLPAYVTNDANAAALGEWRWGAGRGVDDFLMVTLGTGLGSGFIVEGSLLHGASGHAGELGHICVEPGGRRCNCGLQGCLETWVSAGGIMRTVREAGLDLAPWMREGEEAAPLHLHRAAAAGNELAARIFAQSGRVLAQGLATAIHLTSPARVVLGGGVMRAGDWLLDPVRQHLPTLLMEPFRATVSVEASQLDADAAGVLGAAAWAWRGLASGEDARA